MTFDLSAILCDSGAASLEFRPEVGSTNDWAIELASDPTRQLPLLVLAERQTGGRGRGANQWWSADGALTFTLVLDASQLEQSRWPQVALATGVAICQAMQSEFPEGTFALKWPNDVYLNQRKVRGILVEVPSSARQRILIGVGINVNNSFASAPQDLRDRATSLVDQAGGEFNLSDLLSKVVRRIIASFERFVSDPTSLADAFASFCLLTGKIVRIESAREVITGRCGGIARDGALIVHTAKGVEYVTSGTVVDWE